MFPSFGSGRMTPLSPATQVGSQLRNDSTAIRDHVLTPTPPESCCGPYSQYGKRLSAAIREISAVGWLYHVLQLFAPSTLTTVPWSLDSTIRLPSFGFTQIW